MADKTADVLLVEDNPVDALLVEEALASAPRGHFLLTKAERLADATELIRQRHFDVVLLDLGLPDANGVSTLRAMHDVAGDIPILVLTGSIDDAVAIEATRAGAEDYLVKGRADGIQIGSAIRYAMERRSLALKVRNRERLLREAQRVAHVGSWDYNFANGATSYSEELEKIYGGDPSELVNRWQREFAGNGNGNGKAHGTPLVREERIKRPDGAERFIATRVDVILDPRGLPLRLVGVCQDVTERKRAGEALQQSEEHLRGIIDASLDCIITIDHENRIHEFNPAAERTFGFKRAEVAGKLLSETIMPERFRDAQAHALERFLTHGETRITGRRVEVAGLRADGTEFPAELTVTRLGSQTPPRFTAFMRDLTKIKEKEREVERLWDLSLDMICVAGFDGMFKKLNPAWQRTLGHPIAKLQSEPFLSFVHADDLESTREAAAKLVDGGELIAFENRYRCGDGSYRWLQWSCKADAAKELIYGVCRDVSAQRAALEEVAKLRRERELMLNSIGDGVHVLNREGEILFENPAAARMLGYEIHELIGKPAHATIHHSHADGSMYPRSDCPFFSTIADGLPHRGSEEVFWRKDGTAMPIEYSSTPMVDSTGANRGAVVTFRDITERKKAAEELRRSERLFRELANAMPQIVWASPPSGFLDYFNRRAHEYTGLANDELIQSGWTQAVHADDLPTAVERWTRSLQTGETYQVEFRIRDGDGTYRWHLGRALPVRDEQGAIMRWFGTCTDIDDQKRAQETLRRSEASLALAQQVSHTGNWEVLFEDGQPYDPARSVAWSDETFRIFGHEPGAIEVTQGSLIESVHPEDRARVIDSFLKAFEGRERYSLDHRIVLPNGEERVVHEEAYFLHDNGDAGAAVKAIGTVQDITQRKAAEELLRRQAELLDLAHDAIVMRSYDDQRITFWNTGAERLYGWTAAEALGQPVAELLFADAAAFRPILEGLAANGEFRGEIRHFTKDKRELTVNVRSTVVRDARGKPESVLSIGTDVTEHKKLEQQFLRAQRLESIGTLASGVAHDLNNILVPILMAAPLLREPMGEADREKLLDLVEASAERGSGIIRQVLTFARGAQGERLLMQPGYLIKDVAKIVEQTFPKTISVRAVYHENLRTIEADPTQLHQVLLNLCVNARDAMPNGGTLTIQADNFDVDEHFAVMTPGASAGPHVFLEVTDTGTGIPRGVLSKIFDPFFTTKEIGKGTGLGLSTVLGIAKSHGGFVNVYSEMNRGTTFKVFLPASGTDTAAAPCADATIASGRGETVLLVDDEPSIREVGAALLGHCGYAVLTAEDGPDALATFAHPENHIDVVVTDMIMPFMDGTALIRALRKLRPNVPIIATSGRDEEGARAELQELGVNACITKPYSRDTLLRALDAVLQRPPNE